MMRNVLACGMLLLAGAGLLAAQDDGIPAEDRGAVPAGPGDSGTNDRAETGGG